MTEEMRQGFARRYGITNTDFGLPSGMSEEMRQRFYRRYGVMPPGSPPAPGTNSTSGTGCR